jgi:hypothetical protein
VLLSRSRKEPRNFGEARAATRCSSSSDGYGSKLDVEDMWIIEKKSQTVAVSYFFYPLLQQYKS